MAEKIMEVHSASCVIGKSDPLTLTVNARGEVTSSGWTDPRLEPHIYITPPEDGIQGFDFVAERPDGLVFWSTVPVTAEWSGTCESWVKGARVHANGSEAQCNC